MGHAHDSYSDFRSVYISIVFFFQLSTFQIFWHLGDLAHTGIVCENMHAIGANLRKLPGQAKICTPPGGAMVAKICKLSQILR